MSRKPQPLHELLPGEFRSLVAPFIGACLILGSVWSALWFATGILRMLGVSD